MVPDDIREVKAYFEERHTGSAAPDIITEGRTPGDDLELARAQVRPFAEAGLTWWIEFADPTLGDAAAIRTRIAQGPPRLD